MKRNNRFGQVTSGFLLALLISLPVSAEVIGKVTKSVNMPDLPPGTELTSDTQIETGSGQRIAIKTNDGDIVIANPNSVIRLEKPGFFSQLFGKIYYFITPERKRDVTVQTRAATIGIRGTKFLVDSAEDEDGQENVSLVEGKLNFQSNDDEKFELYHERELDEFEKFKRERMAEFQAFKNEMMEEFVAYKASIDLDAGFALRFDGKKVVRSSVSQDMEAEIAEFEQFLANQQNN
jgi:hypothetical protein